MGRADVIDKVLAVGATLLLALVVTAIIRGMPRWGEIGLSVWGHLATVAVALAVAPIQMLRRKGDRLHRLLGRVWAVLLFVTAVISFDIRVLNDGRLGPIHMLSAIMIVSVPGMVWAARTGSRAFSRCCRRGTSADGSSAKAGQGLKTPPYTRCWPMSSGSI